MSLYVAKGGPELEISSEPNPHRLCAYRDRVQPEWQPAEA